MSETGTFWERLLMSGALAIFGALFFGPIGAVIGAIMAWVIP